MGLLDNPQDAAMMQMAMGLLQAGGPSRTPISLGQAIGSSGQDAMQAYRQAQQAQQVQQMRDLQNQEAQLRLAETKRQQAMQESIRGAAKDSYLSPQQQALMATVGPTPQGAAMIPGLQPKFDTNAFVGKLYGIDPLMAMDMKQKLTPQPIKLGADESLYRADPNDPNKLTPIAVGQGKNDIKEGYLVKGQDGKWIVDPELFAKTKELKETAAPKITVSPTVKVGNSFGEKIADKAAENLFSQVEAAKAAPQTAQAANQIITALNSGNVIAGPGTKWSIAARQIFGGDEQKLVATRQTIQALAELSLSSRQSLRGQGSLTDFEQRLLEQAKSGNIDNMTTDEIRLIANGAMKNAAYIHKQGRAAADSLRAMPEFSRITAAFDIPDLYGQQASSGWSAKRK